MLRNRIIGPPFLPTLVGGIDADPIANGDENQQKEVPSYHTFDSIQRGVVSSRNCAIPAASQCHFGGVWVRNFFFYALSFLQTPGVVEASEEGFGGGVLGLILRASLPSQVVLFILIVFSIVSWAVILLKLVQFQSIQRQTASFIEVFRRSGKFSEVQSVCKSLAKSPLTGVFQAGYVELNAQLRQPDTPTEPTRQPDDTSARPTLKSFDALDRALLRASTTEVARLEHRVPFLATTASITPFIGLLGTVWGIIIAFQGIGETGSTNLAVVAPGIAEALIATAAGLFAAIPAVYFYNHLTQRVKEMAASLDDFSLEFLNIAERNFS